MLSFRDLVTGFRQLDIDHQKPAIVHASLSSFGEIRGGAETLLGALISTFSSIMIPSFTYKTMIIPETGPENNGLEYGSGKDLNRMAEFFSPDMPSDILMGVLAEKIRLHIQAKRSMHPILSFSGIHVDEALSAQTLEDPLAPIQWLVDQQGYVLLLGVDHTVNTSIHLAEQLVGRKSFIRWALTTDGVLECPRFPGCSRGFNQIKPHIEFMIKGTQIGSAMVQAIPVRELVKVLLPILQTDPKSLLCETEDCERCNSVRFFIDNRTIDKTNQ
jgi:aminoglycoside 3-N-acetyltransferase